jgi:hypothetical protein
VTPAPMFTIRYDAQRQLLHVNRWSLWNVDQATRYRTDLAVAVADTARRHGSFDLLIDIGRAETMPQDVTLIMAQVAADLETSPARRVAYAGSGALKRLQVRRLVGDPSRFGIFNTIDEALLWLAEGR